MSAKDTQRRKEMQEAYKQMKTVMGVVKITNRQNGKIFVAAFPNLKNKWFSIQNQLKTGRFANAPLQKDWDDLGADAFSYEVLEEKTTDALSASDVRWECKQLEKRWLAQLEPYGERGYNKGD